MEDTRNVIMNQLLLIQLLSLGSVTASELSSFSIHLFSVTHRGATVGSAVRYGEARDDRMGGETGRRPGPTSRETCVGVRLECPKNMPWRIAGSTLHHIPAFSATLTMPLFRSPNNRFLKHLFTHYCFCEQTSKYCSLPLPQSTCCVP